ncbi:MAG TPA: lysophospholipid acyltransferase family protein [Terriglobales bacterium]|nr:lysophospholipid acyltransferase family protein [Terriglobales bacterium]
MTLHLAAIGGGPAQPELEPASSVNGKPHRFSLKQRLALWLISSAGYLAIRLIGPTLRPSFTYEPGTENEPKTRPAIYCFWHRCVFPAAYLFRDHAIRVLTSRSYDGEYIARVIERFGFRAVRGSSSRGAVQSLRELQRELELGEFVAFTIDGPRGPRYVAKPGPIHLARMTGAPIFCFFVAVERAWILNTWDQFIIPKPFSRIHCYVRTPITVSPEADHDEALALMQTQLEEAQKRAEAEFRD